MPRALLGFVMMLTLAGASPAPQPFALLGPAGQHTLPPDAVAGIVAEADAATARQPRARADLHTEGTLPNQGIREESLYAKEDQPAILAMGLAWRTTGKPKYLEGADRYLLAWATTYRPSFNPIDETGFDQLILASDLTGPDLPQSTRARLGTFWRSLATGYLDAMDGQPKNSRTNWQSHRVKLATMAAFASGDPTLIRRARVAYRRQVSANIRADGSVFDFYERDALHYVTYDLDPLLMAALSAKAHGEDWYDWKARSGASLAAAVAWLRPYALGAKTHVEFVRSRIQFDRDRAAAGQKEYAPHVWSRGAAVGTMALSAACDLREVSTAAQVARETGRSPPAWLALVR
ncbi:alginate lyase family protein [Sphingomonas sp. R86521]|uniref:alginate lyase family protein n=1 Tax=Sphingomonas sp. R86521 TaxID=3093860 RepID=UPI0036D41285